MIASTRSRSSHIASMVGGALFIGILTLVWIFPAPGVRTVLLGVLVAIPLLWLTGVRGWYGQYTHSLGRLGKSGTRIASLGLVMMAVGLAGGPWLEFLWAIFGLGWLVLGFGLLLLGGVTLRTRSLPVFGSLVLATGLLSLLWIFTNVDQPSDALRVANISVTILLGAAWIALGYIGLAHTSQPSLDAPAASPAVRHPRVQ